MACFPDDNTVAVYYIYPYAASTIRNKNNVRITGEIIPYALTHATSSDSTLSGSRAATASRAAASRASSSSSSSSSSSLYMGKNFLRICIQPFPIGSSTSTGTGPGCWKRKYARRQERGDTDLWQVVLYLVGQICSSDARHFFLFFFQKCVPNLATTWLFIITGDHS